MRMVTRILALAAMALLWSLACGGGNAPSVPTPTPSPTPGPILAKGRIAFITPEGRLALIEPNGTNLTPITDAGVQAFQWSPDGSLIAIQMSRGTDTLVRVIRPDGQAVFEVPGSAPLWSPAGDHLAVTQGQDVSVVDTAGQETLRVAGGARPVWSPDGSALAVLKVGPDGLGVPVIINVATGEEAPLSPGIEPSKPDYPIAWHPAGNVIAYQKTVYDLTNGTTQDLPGTAVEWNPDGRMLMVTLEYVPQDRATPARLLDFTQGGKQVIGLDVRPAADETPAWLEIKKWTDWTPDGRYLFYMDPLASRIRTRIYDTVAISQDKMPGLAGKYPDISPDGTHVTFQFEGKVWVLPLDKSTLRDITQGSFPAWQPGNQ